MEGPDAMTSLNGLSGPVGGKNVSESLHQTLSESNVSFTKASSTKAIANGSLVEGRVIDTWQGGYLVRIGSQNLKAMANIPLVVGQRFQAIWDTSGDIPVLRLRDVDVALLGSLSETDRPIAEALLLRGLPISTEVLKSLQVAWIRAGGKQNMLAPLVELWARNLPLSSQNINLLVWYIGLSKEELLDVWKKIRQKFHEGLEKGENPHAVLRRLLSDTDDVGCFLQAHSLLMKSARQNHSEVVPFFSAWWPVGEETETLAAKVRVEKRSLENLKNSFWRVAFDLDCYNLKTVSGEVATEGHSLGVTLKVENPTVQRILRRRKTELYDLLDGLPLHTQYISVALKDIERDIVYRRFDVEI